MSFLLGIDIGTSGTKTVLFDQNGRVLASHTKEYPLSQPQNGWAEQNPLDWWDAVAEGCAAVLKESGIPAGDIAGVGLSGQMHGLVMLDKNDQILHPAILWCDQRTGEECREMERLIGLDRWIAVTANPPLTGFTAECAPNRTHHIRLDRLRTPDGRAIPHGVPYAVRVQSDVPIVAQHSRMDVSQPAMTLMTTIPYGG